MYRASRFGMNCARLIGIARAKGINDAVFDGYARP
jgi:hypothetical protein